MALPERQRSFGLIDSLEQDISELIRYHLLRVHSEEQLLTSDELSSARERQDDEAEDLISYLDLGPKVGVILRWKHDISESERPGLTRLATAMEGVYPIRNRVMHGRPLLPDDSEKCIAALTTIADSELNCPRLARTLQHLKADPSWLPPGALVRLPARVLNNLPDADYDDTGLIGRNRERAELMKLLTERRWPVISVIAAGGYGKTALALDVLHEIVGSPDCPFDLVAWVSLKTERLTSSGVVEIEAALRSVGDAIPTIGGLLDSSDASIDDLVQWLDGISTLLVLDNLETATSAEVVELIERMPQDVRFLFTSRVGIGQLEKRFELNPLGQSAAVELLRRLGQSRATYLGGAAQAQLAQLTNKVGFTPLALRWFAEGVAAGLEPAAVLGATSGLGEILRRKHIRRPPARRPEGSVASRRHWPADSCTRDSPALPAWSIDRGRSAIQELVLANVCRENGG
ncbi:MAG: NB-ARC domain-containing protein [Acidimicrobiales bacterium]